MPNDQEFREHVIKSLAILETSNTEIIRRLTVQNGSVAAVIREQAEDRKALNLHQSQIAQELNTHRTQIAQDLSGYQAKVALDLSDYRNEHPSKDSFNSATEKISVLETRIESLEQTRVVGQAQKDTAQSMLTVIWNNGAKQAVGALIAGIVLIILFHSSLFVQSQSSSSSTTSTEVTTKSHK